MKKLFAAIALLLTIAATGAFAADGKPLIVCFTRAGNIETQPKVDATSAASLNLSGGRLTGNTEFIARLIQKCTGGDYYAIRVAEKYPADYDKCVAIVEPEGSRGYHRPIVTDAPDLKKYDVIFLGFPIWHYDLPMPVYSFLDKYDLAGRTIVPFCTSGGSSLDSVVDGIARAEPKARLVRDGFNAYYTKASSVSEKDVRKWLTGLRLPGLTVR